MLTTIALCKRHAITLGMLVLLIALPRLSWSQPPLPPPPPPGPAPCVCTPLVMNSNSAGTQTWWVKALGGPLDIAVFARSVNPVDPETVSIQVFNGGGGFVGGATASYPPGQPPGSEVGAAVPSIMAPPGGDIYRIVVTTPGTPPSQPHYRLRAMGAAALMTGSPSSPSFEEGPVRWRFQVQPGEPLDVKVSTENTPATSATLTYRWIDPAGFVSPSAVTVVPNWGSPQVLSVPSPGAGTWTLDIQGASDHYTLDKMGGIDRGIYVDWASAGESQLRGTITLDGVPNTMPVTLEIRDLVTGDLVTTLSLVTNLFDGGKLRAGDYVIHVIVPPGVAPVPDIPVRLVCNELRDIQIPLVREQMFDLTVGTAGSGSGTVTSVPSGIDCGATCSASYVAGALVTLTATPDATSSFAGWSGACTGTGACVVTMDAAKAVTATFTLQDTGTISNRVWLDADADGVQGFFDIIESVGVTVDLLDGTTNALIATTTTTPGYSFTGLPAGTYKLRFTAPSGYGFTLKDQGGDDAVDSDPDPATGITDAFTLAAGASDTTRDAGLVSADTTTTKSGPATTTVGGQITYTITVKNNGPTAARNVRTTDVLPAGTTYVSSSNGCDAVNGTVTCTTALLGNGETVTYTIVVITTTSGTKTNTTTTTSDTPDPTGGDNSSSTTTTVNEQPTISLLDEVTTEGNSGTHTLPFVVRLSMASTETVTVDFTTADGTATAGSDYVATSGTLIFAPGETIKGVSVTVNGDTTAEADQTFTVTLSNATRASIAITTGTGTILNDDYILVASTAGTGVGNIVSAPAGIDCPDGAACVTSFGSGTVVTLTATAAAGSTFTGWSFGDCSGTGTCTLSMDADKSAYATFAIDENASISNFVWRDLNGNGIQEPGEPGQPGVAVQLYSDLALTVLVGATATDAGGMYSFTGLPAGATYRLRFLTPAGWGWTVKDAGTDDTHDSDVDQVSSGWTQTDAFALAAGASDDTRDGGLVQADTTTTKIGTSTTTVGGQITYTITVKNNGPTTARNVRTTDVLPAGTIYVSSSNGCDAVNGTVTCTTGLLGNGETVTYTIVVTTTTSGTKTNTTTTTSDTPDPTGGDNSSSTTTTVENRPPTITVPADITVVASSSAGAVVTYSVTASDPDGDAVTISCSPASGSTFAIGTTTTTCTATDTHGASASASFSVTVVNNPPWITTPTSITANATSSSGAVVTYSVTAGDPDGHAVTTACVPPSGSTFPIGTTLVDCTVTDIIGASDSASFSVTVRAPDGSISDYVWQDLNSNGIQEAGEPGLAGVAVTLLDATGVVGVPTATSPTGHYLFTGLAPGSYQVKFMAPGWGFTLKDAGPDNVDSDADPSTGITDLFALAPGATDTSRDAGLVRADTTTTKIGTSTTTVGGQITYTITVKNNGPTVARNVRTTDVLPAGTTYVSSSAGCDAVNGTVTCTTALLGNGETVTYTIVVITTTSGTKTNTTTTTSDTPDPTGGDNSSSTTTTVNEQPTISLLDEVTTEGNSGTHTLPFVVVLSTPSTETVTVDFTTADGTAIAGSDYVATSGTLIFAPGETIKGLSVTVNGDLTFEADETFTVTLSNATRASIAITTGTGTIVNDDATPAITISDASVTEGNTGTTSAIFTVSLSNPSDAAVGVDFATADGAAVSGTDYVSNTGALTLAPGTTSQTITVLVNGDTLVEADEIFLVNLTGPVNATIADNQASGLILNDDADNASISDQVWKDLNGNGIQEAGEPGFGGVVVSLLDGSGTPVGAPAVTNASGLYSFTGLAAGTYMVQVVPPAGWSFTLKDQGGNDALDSDPNPATGITDPFALAAGATDDTRDAGLVQANTTTVKTGPATSTIGSPITYTITVNNQGPTAARNVRTSDVLPAGLTYSSSSNGCANANGTVTCTTASLGANETVTYTIIVTAASAGAFTNVATTTSDTADPDGSFGSVSTTVPQSNAAIGNQVWLDMNADGVYDDYVDGNADGVPDGSEVLLMTSMTVELLDGTGASVASTTTDRFGDYAFTGLAPGTYRVKFTAPAGFRLTLKDQGTSDAYDSDPDRTTGVTDPIILAAGEINDTVDAGFITIADVRITPGTLNSIVAGKEAEYKVNVDNLGPSPANNVTTTITLPPTSTVSSVSPAASCTITPGSVACNLGTVQSGGRITVTVRVTFQTPGPITITNSTSFTGFDPDPDNDTASITTDVSVPHSISDFVWVDTNQDGMQDLGEPGLGGINVRLYPASDRNNQLAWVISDANGYYAFNNLAAGAYSVRFEAPFTGDYALTQMNAGDDAKDSDPDSTGWVDVTVPATTANTDAGFVRVTDLKITAATIGTLLTGRPFTFDVTLENRGPGLATNVMTTVTVPPGAVVTTIPVGCVINLTGSGLTCTTPTLPSQQIVIISFRFTVVTPGPVSFAVETRFEGRDLNPADNAATIDLLINQSAFALTVTHAGNGSGTITSTPAGIDCGATCTATFDAGTEVTLTPTADVGSTFAGWSGACVGPGACAVTMDAAKSVTATFAQNLPGKMEGEGRVDGAAAPLRFQFNVRESNNGNGAGRLQVRLGNARPSRFESTVIAAVTFSDDPGFQPGRRQRPTIDTAVFTGVGQWNGEDGYTFEVRATDRGEPGRNDTFSIVIRSPLGVMVASVEGPLSGGNIQSERLNGKSN